MTERWMTQKSQSLGTLLGKILRLDDDKQYIPVIYVSVKKGTNAWR
jgi:hypothetical protein